MPPGGRRTGAGRKPLPPGQKKVQRLTVRLRASMWDWLERQAAAKDMTVNQVVECLVEAKRREFAEYAKNRG